MNKRLAVFIFLFLIFGFSANAQHFLGIRGGGTLNKLLVFNKQGTQGQYDPTEYRQGFVGGLVYRYVNAPHIGLQAEGLYFRKGYNKKLSDVQKADRTGRIFPTREAIVDYLQMNFLSYIYVFQGPNKVYFTIGPYFGYGLSGTEKVKDYQNGAVIKTENRDIDFSASDYTQLDYGFEFGLGFERAFSFGLIDVDFRYTWGMGNIYNADKPYFPDHTQNQSLNFSVSYLFQIDKKSTKFSYTRF
ncbi:MAG: PorT family protein [Cytophagales bacterium]|nr:PorT family protein [Cytophagales bacterium]